MIQLTTQIKALICCIFLLAGACKPDSQQSTSQQKPNVLFIAVDDLNDWLGCMQGHPNAITPNMDRLASRGVLFSDAHCQAPLCGPSRASLMTGLRPSTTGIYGMIDDNKIRNPENEATSDIIFLPEYFKNNGYHTMGIGKLFHHHAPDGVFDESGGRVAGFGPVPDHRFVWDGLAKENQEIYGRTSTDWGAYPSYDSLMPDYQSAQWAIERLERDYQGEPFFLAVGFLRPHVPFYVPEKWFDKHSIDGIEMPPYQNGDLDDVPDIARDKINDLPMMPSTQWAIETGYWDDIVQAYLACVSFVDHQIGTVVNALEQSQYADNTIVVLWSDHGYRLGEKETFAKHCLWQEATNAPLIFSGPGIPEGKVIGESVEMLSIYPTLLELCTLDPYPRNEGISLVPLMGNKTAPDKVFSATTTFGMNNHTVKTKNFRYIRYEDGSEELYDHDLDPNEWNNLAESPDYVSQKNRLIKLLPEKNAFWDENSAYTFQPYFVEQKKRTSNSK